MAYPELISPLAVQDWGNLILAIFLLIVVLLVGFGGPGLLAHRQGYAWYCWFLANLLGALVMFGLPNANDPKNTPEENARRRRRGNLCGLLITAIVVAFAVASYFKLLPRK